MAIFKPPTKGTHYHLRTLIANNPNADRGVLRKLASLGDYALSEEVSSDMYETPEQMLEDLQARRQPQAAGHQENPQRLPAWTMPLRTQPPAGTFVSQQESPSVFTPGQQFGHLQGMAGQVAGAVGDENDSRVAQAREARRQEHEYRLQMDALLARLQHERFMAARNRQAQQEAADKARGMTYNSEWGKPLRLGVDY